MGGLSDDKQFIIQKDKSGHFGIINNIEEERKHDILKNYYEIEHYNKPIRSISAYKVDDIRIIATKLHILHKDYLGNKKTKNKLYDDIISHISI